MYSIVRNSQKNLINRDTVQKYGVFCDKLLELQTVYRKLQYKDVNVLSEEMADLYFYTTSASID